jgi:hypothetical protein
LSIFPQFIPYRVLYFSLQIFRHNIRWRFPTPKTTFAIILHLHYFQAFSFIAFFNIYSSHSWFFSSVFIYRFFTDLSLRLRADISKVTAHERIQYLYYSGCRNRLKINRRKNYSAFCSHFQMSFFLAIFLPPLTVSFHLLLPFFIFFLSIKLFLFSFDLNFSLFNFSLLYYFLGCFFFYLFFSLLLLFMYMPMNIIFLYITYYLLPFVDSFVLGLIKAIIIIIIIIIIINNFSFYSLSLLIF